MLCSSVVIRLGFVFNMMGVLYMTKIIPFVLGRGIVIEIGRAHV